MKIRSFTEIYNSLVTWVVTGTNKLTDFNVGSALRTLLESVALQLEEFYFSMKQNCLSAIDSSVFNAFGFQKQEATYSSGYVEVTFNKPLESTFVIPIGTIFSTSITENKIYYYQSTEDTVVQRGAPKASVLVRCTELGSQGNMQSGEICNIVTTNRIYANVTNTLPLTGGYDEEDSQERKLRFNNYVKSLARGTKDSLLHGVLEVEGVKGAWVDDNYIGYVKIFVHDADGNLPQELKLRVLENLEYYRACGIEVQLFSTVRVPVDVELNIVFQNNVNPDAYLGGIKQLIKDFINNHTVSQDFYTAELIATVINLYRTDIITVNVVKGSDTKLQFNELVVSGDIVVTGINQKDWRS